MPLRVNAVVLRRQTQGYAARLAEATISRLLQTSPFSSNEGPIRS